MNLLLKLVLGYFLTIIALVWVWVAAEDGDTSISIDLASSEWTDLSSIRKIDDELTIVGTVDGYVHAIDSSNKKKWSTQTGDSMISSYQNIQPGISQKDYYSIIPSIDGSLLIHNAGGMRKTSVKARMLAEKTPFVSVDGELIFTGNRKTKVLGLDVNSGEITHEIIDGQSTTAILTDKSDSGKTPLWIGRVDYTVRAFDGTSGTEKFNLSFTELSPLHQSRIAYHEASIMNNHKLEIDAPNSFLSKDLKFPRIPHKSTPKQQKNTFWKDTPDIPDKKEDIYHAIHFDSPAMAAFRVRKNIRGDVETYDVESLKISNKASSIIDHDGVHHDEIIEIRTLPNGGLYALQTDPVDISDYDSKDILSFLESSSNTQYASNDGKKFLTSPRSSSGKPVSAIQLHSKQPFRSSLSFGRNYANLENEKITDLSSDSKSQCVVYPKSFKSTKEIDDTTTKLLVDSKEYDIAMCLVGHHRLLPGYSNDLPFLPKQTPVISEDLKIPISQRMKSLQTILLTVLGLLLIWMILHAEKMKKYFKVWVTSLLADDYLTDIRSGSESGRHRDHGSDYSEVIDENGRKVIKVGALIVHDRILGYGSHGTVVFSGNLNGRPVAVKRMLSQFSRVADRFENDACIFMSVRL
jgi:PQQ enzyme repeat